MNIAQIEINLQKLIATFNKETFIYQLLLAYGLPKASITRLQKPGGRNLSKIKGEISWKKKLFFKEEQKEDLHLTISEITKELKHNERFVIITDYTTLLAVDTKTDDKLDIELKDLPKHYDFFLPWAGMEKAQHANENPADVKAAEKMAKLFDEIKKDNPNDDPVFVHGLNVFLSRLLFCFFAEDTHIFKEANQFTNAVDSHTQADGSDLDAFLDRIFTILNTPNKHRLVSEVELPDYLDAFPYVNGGLFEKDIKTPQFTRRSRQAIIDAGELDWSGINPDIFGSMFQAVIGAEQRGSLGQHYTSVPNIMKVIEPLFLNDLYEEFDASASSAPALKQKKLNALLKRIHNIKIFDPACGSGNFLIIAYKELRLLEMKILKELKTISGTLGSGSLDFGNDYLSHISLSQFYGIEIDDFAGEIAKLALWLAEHQMNVEFFKEFGRTNPTLPLKEAGKIIQGNAIRLDWEEVCPKTKEDGEPAEVYILGNPPYLGARFQSIQQKEDINIVLKNIKGRNSLDYISCWFYNASKFIKNSISEFAFVSTNSICQGQQVGFLWPSIFGDGNDIKFGYSAFYWSNNAKSKAVVAVIIVGVKNSTKTTGKFILSKNLKEQVSNISPYLTSGSDLVVEKRQKSLSNLPPLVFGNQSIDGGNLILTNQEKIDLLQKHPNASKFIRRFYGWNDLSKNILRWCIWIKEPELNDALLISGIKKRIENVKTFRFNGGQVARSLTDTPYRFRYVHEAKESFIAIGRNSSENRKYLPADFKSAPDIPGETMQVIYDAEPYLFGLISSNMHMLWVKAVAGGMKMDILYSVTICYNTFPFPKISTQRKNEITQATFRILEEREKHSDKTLAQLYDPDKMPEGLRQAHRDNDIIIEKCYRSTPFKSDEERLEYLFKLYEKMIAEEKAKGSLFEVTKKKRKAKK